MRLPEFRFCQVAGHRVGCRQLCTQRSEEARQSQKPSGNFCSNPACENLVSGQLGWTGDFSTGRAGYSAGADGHWNEFFIVFHGPVFDVWRDLGLVSLNGQNCLAHSDPHSGTFSGCISP
jgi:hypothetical protein